MSNLFNSIRVRAPKRSTFNMSHEVKLSTSFGVLTPIMCEEVLPGDTYRDKTEIMVRFAPMLAPIMHRVNVYTHFFFVPNRLVWNQWDKFITQGTDGKFSEKNPNAFPCAKYSDLAKVNFGTDTINPRYSGMNGSLLDYLGIPTVESVEEAQAITSTELISLMPFRAYQLIWREYYRDQNIETDEADEDEDVFEAWYRSGGTLDPSQQNQILSNLVTLRSKCWEKDYFTSALPWAQRGGDVQIPFDASSSIVYKNSDGRPGFWKASDGSSPDQSNSFVGVSSDGQSTALGHVNGTDFIGNQVPSVAYDPNGTLQANFNLGKATTINALRQAVQLQRWLEINSVAGARYKEQILAHFGVVSPDARLQRPEYLGGGRTPVVISEVLQTSQTTEGSTPSELGDMAGHGFAIGSTHGFQKRFKEHGFIIGIMSILPRSAYQQGLPKKFTRMDYLDYYFPVFANLGEQEIKNKELYFATQGTDVSNNNGVFGYIPRYAEYRYIPSTVHGDFRGSLDYWHLGRIFNQRPALNPEFVHVTDPSNDLERIFAVTDSSYHKLWIQIYHNLTAVRPMPKYATPSFGSPV